jgi:NAD(P)-dependent dehydrogenase (short-subunit alcohol dehydrogenase family)
MNKEKHVLITGANSGIGKEAALRFARAGYTVIMGCRNAEKGEEALREIRTQSSQGRVHLYTVDMGSFASIRAFSNKIKTDFQRLDILINNAAYFNHGAPYTLSEDGIEITFATNVLGPYLLMEELTDLLSKAENPCILNASSNIVKHFFSPDKQLDLENLRGISDPAYKHRVYDRYRDSKMALVLLTFGMAASLKKKGIRINALQINGAKMSRETLQKFKGVWRLIARVQNLFFPPAAFMAENYFQICTSEAYEGVTGALFNHRLEVMLPAPQKPGIKDILGSSAYPCIADNTDMQQRIHRLSREWTRP